MTAAVDGLLDTSVVIELEQLAQSLSANYAISTITLAELAVGPHATDDELERARRQERLQLAESSMSPLPFDSDAARVYGRVFAATREAGRNPRGRALDLLIAAVALANGLPLYTRNPVDFAHLESIGLDVRAV